MSTRYVALLRGINVGGKNLIKMAALARCFEELGADDVKTYIASGNVLFSSVETARALVPRLEAGLAARFGYPASLVLRTRAQMQRVVASAPPGFGARPERFLSDVLFLKEPLTARAAMKSVLAREGVDQAWPGPGVVYYARIAELAARSLLPRLAAMPIYKQMTVRSWSTATKLTALMAIG